MLEKLINILLVEDEIDVIDVKWTFNKIHITNLADYILKFVNLTNFVEIMATLNKSWILCETP